MITKPYKSLTEQEKSEVVNWIKRLHLSDNQAMQDALYKGKVCYDFVKCKTLSSDEEAEMEAADKIPVHSVEALIKIAAIVGMLSQTAKDGVIVGNGPEDAASAEQRMTILKNYVERLSQVERAELQCAQDTLITSIPCFMWLEPYDPRDPSKPGLTMRGQPWESVVVDAAWRSHTMSDMRRIHRHLQLSADDVVARGFAGAQGLTPEQLKELEDASANATYKSDTDYIDARNGTTYTVAGLLNVIESLEFRWMEVKCAFDAFGNPEILPIGMTPEQEAAFIESLGPVQIAVSRERVLWSTVWTASGILLDYGPHWLQIREFPCEPFVPANLDGHWAGIIEYTLDINKAMTYALTEHLQGVRTSINNTWKAKRGAIKNVQEFENERMRAGGTVFIEEGYNLDDVNPVGAPRESQAHMDWRSVLQEDMSRLTVDRNFEGGAQASQESSKAIGARITQDTNKMQFWLAGYNPMRLGIRRKATKAMPYAMPDSITLRIADPKNGLVEMSLNEPAGYDFNGDAVGKKNNLHAGEWDYTFTDADTSINGQEFQRAVFSEFLKFAQSLPPEAMIAAAKAYPSTSVQAYGAELEAQQKAAQEAPPPPPPPPRVSLTISSGDIGQDATMEVMRSQGLLPPEEASEPEGAEMELPPEGTTMELGGPAPEEQFDDTAETDPSMAELEITEGEF